MFSNSLFTNKGDSFEITNILNKNHKLNVDECQKYSPPYYSTGNIVSYGAFIASYPMFAYSMLTQWKVMLGAFKQWGQSLVTHQEAYLVARLEG